MGGFFWNKMCMEIQPLSLILFWLYSNQDKLTIISTKCCFRRLRYILRHILRHGDLSESLEVFNRPQTDCEDGCDDESQRNPGEHLTKTNWQTRSFDEKFSLILPSPPWGSLVLLWSPPHWPFPLLTLKTIWPPPHSPLHPPGDEQELVPKTIFCHIIFYKALKFELILCRRVYTTWQKWILSETLKTLNLSK